MSQYMFMSFSTVGFGGQRGRNIGCCIIECDDPNQANEKCKELGLMPDQQNHAKGYPLDEDQFKEQGMELNRFYTKEEMEAMQFESERSTI